MIRTLRRTLPILLSIVAVDLSAISQDQAVLETTLESSIQRGNWNEASEVAFELLRQDPENRNARMRGAYALFQRGFHNSALLLLRKISPEQWKSLPQGQERLIQVVSLFQKKVPLNVLPARLDQVNIEDTASYLHDELRFAKGRAAFEAKNYPQARELLQQISKTSRYYGPASYVLGTIDVQQSNYSAAATEYSKMFEPRIFDQSSEFWNDVGAQTSSLWGNTVRVQVDTKALDKSSELAELGLMALARTAYATKDFYSAIQRYNEVPKTSPLYARARLEKVWSLLALNKHEEAQKAAQDLSVDGRVFESLEAHPVRALILTDAGQTTEARREIDYFLPLYKDSKEALNRYVQFPNRDNLPVFLRNDLDADERLKTLAEYQESLRKEAEALRSEERRLYPVYMSLSSELEPLITQARDYTSNVVMTMVQRRLSDLERLYVQSKLIVAETYLEDREKLRKEFREIGAQADLLKQKEHDRRLVGLLSKAIQEVDDAMRTLKDRNLMLEFRQSELLWELSSASDILAQDSGRPEDKMSGEEYRMRSIRIAKDIADNFPKFEKHAQAMFFAGFALIEINKVEEGVAYLNKYVSMYPQHTHAPDAFRILGDLEFDANRFKTADAYYYQILNHQTSPIVGYALYKIGWCNYNLRNYAKAMLGLEQAIIWARSLEATDQLLNLKREARRDLISIYAEVGDHRKAYEYFDRFIGQDTADWLAGLAKQYEENGIFEKSTDLYKQLIALNIPAEQKIVYQTSIIRGAYKLRRWDLALDGARDLVGTYAKLLQPVQEKGTQAFEAEKDLNEAVMVQHYEFKDSEVPADIERVLALDRLYLQAFSEWPNAQLPLYQFAHFLLKHKRNKDAAEAFRKHWKQFNASLKEPVREEAIRNLVHSLDLLETEKKEGAPAPTALALELLEATDTYVKQYPKTKHARPIAFLRSALLFKYNKNEEGIAATQAIFDSDSKDDFGKRAFKNIRVAYYNLKDWKRTFEWSTKLLGRPEISSSDYFSDLRTVREESLFLWAENAKDNIEAAQLFLQVSDDPQMIRLRDKALYNAFLRFQKENRRIEALEVGTRLERTAPQFKENATVAGLRAAIYQEAGDYERALPLFTAFLAKPPADTSPDTLQQARLNSALMSEAVGKAPAAIQLYKDYIAKAKDSDAPGVKTAKVGLERIQQSAQRAPAAMFKGWDGLIAQRADLEKNPLPKNKDLAARIQGGAQKLEKVLKSFVDVSSNQKIPQYYAFEAYCSIPFLYRAYQKGIRSLGTGQPQELVMELEKLAAPLDTKSEELALECLKKSEAAFHDGPQYRQVMFKWGWQKSEALNDLVAKLGGDLIQGFPFLDKAPMPQGEEQLLSMHLREQGNPDSWYSLAKLRYDAKRMGLARLTFIDALSKSPNTPRILNALAAIENSKNPDPITLMVLFEKAADAGSAQAQLNLGVLHLQSLRLDQAMEHLLKAKEGKAFDLREDLVGLLTDIDGKLTAMRKPAEVVVDGAKTEAASDKSETKK